MSVSVSVKIELTDQRQPCRRQGPHARSKLVLDRRRTHPVAPPLEPTGTATCTSNTTTGDEFGQDSLPLRIRAGTGSSESCKLALRWANFLCRRGLLDKKKERSC